MAFDGGPYRALYVVGRRYVGPYGRDDLRHLGTPQPFFGHIRRHDRGPLPGEAPGHLQSYPGARAGYDRYFVL
jgi:hypothetical protein